MTSDEFEAELVVTIRKALVDLSPHKTAVILSKHLSDILFSIDKYYENLSKDPSNNTANSNTSSTNSNGKSS